MKRRQHFAFRSWNGHWWAYAYAGPIRLTLFSSSWFSRRRGGKPVIGWLLTAGLVLGTFFFAGPWLSEAGKALVDWTLWVLNNGQRGQWWAAGSLLSEMFEIYLKPKWSEEDWIHFWQGIIFFGLIGIAIWIFVIAEIT